MSSEGAPVDFELVREGNLWVATHVETGVASQGSTPSEAVEMTEEAAELARQEHQPGDDEFQEQMLEELDIDLAERSDFIETPDGMA